ncbi:hypothetical protein D9C73_005660 [Collichthys lucidus]|uniref:F-box domain-containing protein n=1 Tax=Collichthys lucidus TaxID=240159 RepID=A0A4U5UAH2_COLLU|nr:hypothetical protein D9C73_005660 [Collichthys lucidus]
MAQPALQLPSEVWNHVFGYLSPADKFSVRASCKYFKELVDHGSLWKDWSIVLRFQRDSYDSHFWATLRHRKVTSAVVRSCKVKDFKNLARCLPALTTLVMWQSSRESLACLKDFTNLKRLAIRSSCAPLLLDPSAVLQPQQLTHLSICDFTSTTLTLDTFISFSSQFTNLLSLVCHHLRVFQDAAWLVASISVCLPKLKHLSLSHENMPQLIYDWHRPNPGSLEGAHRQAGATSLSSLELLSCFDYLDSEDLMKPVPGLKSLSIMYRVISDNGMPAPACRLKTWLSDLPQLSTLVILRSPPVQRYVTSIPATVTSLTLCVAGLSSEDMAAVAVQVPNLLHLHIDSWPSHLGAHVAQIPQLFPKLKSLKLRHEHVPEKDFLQLHQLQDLEYLEILDGHNCLPEFFGKIKALANNRLQVTASPQQRDVWSCTCAL